MEAKGHRGRQPAPESPLRRNRDFPQAAFPLNKYPSRVRSTYNFQATALFLAILPPLVRYHAHPQNGLAILVIDPLPLPRSRTLLLTPCTQRRVPYTIPQTIKGKGVGQRVPTQGAPPVVDHALPPPGIRGGGICKGGGRLRRRLLRLLLGGETGHNTTTGDCLGGRQA